MQSSGIVDCKDAATAGADLGNIDRRRAQKIPSALVEPAAFSMMIREAPKFTGQKIPESAGRLGVVLSPEGASQKVSVVDEKGAGKQTEKVLPTSTSLDYRLRLPSALKSLGLEPRRTQSPLQKNVATLARAEEVLPALD
jgi:hypothetical protein